MPASEPLPLLALVTGPEELLVDRAVSDLVQRVREARPDAETVHVQGGDLGSGEWGVHVSASLFSEVRVVVLHGAQDAPSRVLSEVADFVRHPDPDVALVVTHTGVAKGKQLVDALREAGAEEVTCPKLTRPSERVGFVRGEFRAAGRAVTEGAAQALVDAVGNDLRNLANACAQLVSDTTGRVDDGVVARYYRGRAEVTSFQVADAAVEGRVSDALQSLRWLLALGDPRSPAGVIAALAQGLRQIARVADAGRVGRPAELARQLGIPPWKIDRVRRQVRGWTPDRLAAAMATVADADEQVKTGADKSYAVERAVAAVASSRSARRDNRG